MEIPDQVFKILCEFSLGRNYYFLSNTFFKNDMWDKKKMDAKKVTLVPA